jgi:2-methylcitrate dehydratase PrpD
MTQHEYLSCQAGTYSLFGFRHLEGDPKNMVKQSATAIEVLANWAAHVTDQHTEVAYSRAQDAVLDTVGCALFGADHSAPSAVRTAVASWGGGTATVIGSDRHAAPPWAALINGTAAHAHDLDDHELAAITHPSTVIVPALLALAEDRNASGREVLDAYIIGLEVITRIGESVNMPFYHRGWHATSTIGAIGAAAACARLMHLDFARIAAALSIATSMAAGCNSQVGTMVKPTHAGLAAKAGVIAASLAGAGMTASHGALDAEWSSFLSLYAGPDAKGFADPLAKIGNPLAIEEYGLVVKIYPCCGFISKPIDAILDMRTRHKFTADDVSQVTVTMPCRNLDILLYPEPKTETEARFSVQYCVAVALLYGQLTSDDFLPPALTRQKVRGLIPLIELCGHPPTPASLDPAKQGPDVVIVHLNDGRVFTESVDHARGTPALPLDRAELLAKFNSCAARLEHPDRVAALEALERFRTLPEVSQLTRHLVFGATT